MITNISYNVLIERFRAFAEGHYLIKGFTHGDPSNVNLEKGVEFPWMHVFPVEVAPQSGSRNYSFIITFADLPRDKETPPEYQREMLSDCIRLAEDLLAEIQNGLTLFGPTVELDGSASIECFINEFSHTLTGVNLSLTLSVPWDWSACDIPADWSVGGSGSGGTGAGQGGIVLETNGELNGDQTLLNLQQGANVTINDNGSGTITISAGVGSVNWGDIVGTLGDQTDLQTALDAKANSADLGPTAFSNDYNDLDNLPTIPTATSELTNDSGFITLGDVPPQVNADWNSVSGVSQILNKPTIPAAQLNSDWAASSGVAQILNKPTIPAAQIQSDWTQANTSALDFIKNKPTIPAAQVNSDWNASSGVAQILNKPTIPAAQIQSDWNQSNTSALDYIKNKPTISSGIKHASATGTDTYVATISGVTAYADGDAYLIRFANGNTTGCTLNINSIGAVSLYRNNDGLLIGGDIWAGAEMLCIYNATSGGFQCIGTSPNSLFAYVTNAETATTITKGQPVYAFGGTGDRLKVKLAYNTSDATSAQTVGMVVSTSIAPNQKGIIIVAGQLDNLSTLPTSTFADGDPIYLGATAGTITNVKPFAPNHLVYLGFVTTASPGNAGRMYVRVQNGYEMNELHDVQSNGAANNDILYRDTAANLWKPASIPTILGYTPVTNARTISTSSPLSGGGDLSADRTLSIADAAADGTTKGAAAFTAVDFNSVSGVISIDYANAQKATSGQPGFLTAADWSTFNGKQAALVSGTNIKTVNSTSLVGSGDVAVQPTLVSGTNIKTINSISILGSGNIPIATTDSTVFSGNPNATQGANSTAYWCISGSLAPSSTENFRNIVMPVAGTLKNLYIRNGTTQSGTGSMVFTLRKNGADTAMTVTFTNADGATATKSDTTNTVSVVAGDLICIKGVNNAPSSASGNIVSFSILLER